MSSRSKPSLAGVPSPGARPACSAASPWNAWNHVQRQPGLVLGRPAAAGPAGGGGAASSPSSKSRVCSCTATAAAGQPGGLVGERPGRRQRAVDAADRLAAGVQRRGQQHARPSSGIGSRNSGYGANGAVRIADPDHRAGVVARRTHQRGCSPPAVPALSRPLGAPRRCGRPRRSTVLSTGSAARCAAAAAEEGGRDRRRTPELEASPSRDGSAEPAARRLRATRFRACRALARALGFRAMTEHCRARPPEHDEPHDRRAVVVPDKPALEGLEEKWARALEGRRHLRLRPHPAARERLLDRHSAADRQRQRCTSATSSPTPTPT